MLLRKDIEIIFSNEERRDRIESLLKEFCEQA